MSSECENWLVFEGQKKDISGFLKQIKTIPDFGKFLYQLEKKGEKEDLSKNLPETSQHPWVDSISIGANEITWESRDYPSIIAVLKLSMLFPEITFNLDYQTIGDYCKGFLVILDGKIIRQEIVDFSKNVVDILINDHGMLSLDEGEKIESIGSGRVQVICTEVQKKGSSVTKTFNVIFECDRSPVFAITIGKSGKVSKIKYSDNDGNDRIEDSGYHWEMIADLQ